MNARSAASELRQGLGVARLGVVLCVAVAAAVTVGTYPWAIDHFDRVSDENSALHFDDREFAGGNGLVVNQQALYEARALIPRNERYHVVVGPLLKNGTELTLPYISSYAIYFLMPRRPSETARWIVCYGCDPAQWGDRYEALWRDDENGISVGRLRS